MKKYQVPKRVKIGRNKFVVDFDNKTPLIGLSFDTGNGQYFYTFFLSEKDYRTGKKTRKDYSFGVNYTDAVLKFKAFKSESEKLFLSIPDNASISQTIDIPVESFSHIRTGFSTQANTFIVNPDLHEKLSFDLDKDLTQENLPDGKINSTILTDKKYGLYLLKQLLSVEEYKIEAIRILKLNELLPKEYRIVSLKEISEFYKDNNTVSKACKGKVKNTIKHFTKITKKHNLNDIKEEDIIIYRDFVKNENKSESYIANRFRFLKSALNFYLENKSCNGEKELIRQVLTVAKEKLKSGVPTAKEGPKSIDVTTAQKIFDKAKQDKELYLMFLIMLNCGYYPIDIRQLKKSMIKTKDNMTYIIHRRSKTGKAFIRINVLWDITAKLLKEYIEENPNSDYVFLSDRKDMYAEDTMSKKLNNFFHDNNINHNAKHFRDTVASSLAFKVTNNNYVKVTLGHCINDKNNEFWKYVESNPEEVLQVKNILWDKYKGCF